MTQKLYSMVRHVRLESLMKSDWRYQVLYLRQELGKI